MLQKVRVFFHLHTTKYMLHSFPIARFICFHIEIMIISVFHRVFLKTKNIEGQPHCHFLKVRDVRIVRRIFWLPDHISRLERLLGNQQLIS